MKRFSSFVLGLALIAAVIGAVTPEVFAQTGPGATVTPSGQRGDAGSICGSNTSATVVSMTVGNPGTGLSNYVTALQTYSFGSASTATTAPSAHTLSGVGSTATAGANLLVGIAAGAGGASTTGWVQGTSPSFATPIKGATATSMVFTGGTAIANANQAIFMCWYIAP